MRNVILASTMLAFAGPATAQVVDLGTGGSSADPEAKRIAVELAPGLRSTRDLPWNLQQARRRLIDGQTVSMTDLRQMADRGDGFASYRFAERLMETGNPDLADDAAHYYGMAAATGRAGAIFGLVKAVDAIKDVDAVPPRRLDVIRDILLAYARAGNSRAIDAVLQYHLDGVPFGSFGDDVESLVLAGSGDGAGAVSLQLATALLQQPDPTREELERARDYLERAQASESMRTVLIAGNLLPGVETALAALPAPAPDTDDAPITEDTQ